MFNRIPPHRIIRQTFGREMADGLLGYAVSSESEFEETTVKGPDGDRVVPSYRISTRLPNWRTMRKEVKERLRALLPVLSAELGLMPFELYHLDLELVAHGDGAFFAYHADTMTGKSADLGYNRILSAVYYFNSEPKAFSGGALRLYALAGIAGRDVGFVDIEPEHDMLVAFPSWAPHEVLRVNCPSKSFTDSRFAINCWFCSKAS